MAVRNFWLEGFSGKLRRCWKILPEFPAARHAIPAKVCALFGKEHGLGKSKGELTNGGLSPKFSEKILPGKSGLFGANWRHFRAGRGLFGADRHQFLCTPQPRGKSRNCPERALFGPIGPFRAKPPFAKPPFGFLRTAAGKSAPPSGILRGKGATRPATLRGKWHSERVSEKPLKTSKNL